MVHPVGVNAGFAVTDRGPVHIDCGFTVSCGRTLLGYGRAVTGKRPPVLCLTSHYAEHIFGQRAFTEAGADLWVHRRYNDLYSEHQFAGYPEIVIAAFMPENGPAMMNDIVLARGDREFSRKTSVVVGGRELVVVPTPGPAETCLSVFVPDAGVLFAGDVVWSGHDPAVGSTGPEEWGRWIESLDLLEELEPKLIVPGHGRTCTRDAIAKTREYVQLLVESGRKDRG